MSCLWSRRVFLKDATTASAAAIMALSYEEHLLAQQQQPVPPDAGLPDSVTKGMPMGRIKHVTMSRLIAGGNLINGQAHSRDLIYVSPLIREYHTVEKIMDTMQRCEDNGINTMSTWASEKGMTSFQRYWKERGGKLQWLGHANADRHLDDVKKCIDNGCVGMYIAGDSTERLFLGNQFDQMAKALELLQQNGLIAGVACHMLQVPMKLEELGIPVDFYMKTIHHAEYFSAPPKDRQTAEVRVGDSTFDKGNDRSGSYYDNFWCRTPEDVKAFMQSVQKPWVGFKVLAAGAIPAREGFKYALEAGADFLHVGMFDFQVEQDALMVRRLIDGRLDRARPWCA